MSPNTLLPTQKPLDAQILLSHIVIRDEGANQIAPFASGTESMFIARVISFKGPILGKTTQPSPLLGIKAIQVACEHLLSRLAPPIQVEVLVSYAQHKTGNQNKAQS